MAKPEILIVAPPEIVEPRGSMAAKFPGAAKRSAGFALELARVADEAGILFLDGGGATEASAVDGIHLDAEQHVLLGEAIARKVSVSGVLGLSGR